ncbi:TetR family transcriptional regulator [Amycolatopsis sp. OK19-0408]|uniref:TetR family transcriptional regulator n=1 Tax=Amycolatopsis iheyensis TaxID=2945988 RepID=A0A9X2N9D9_9PSEU|nr:TetR/AcrR family transcriptional regulator [Amycolatopsis iheyensis]MCR6483672.1 TetR family transcriptional regulator [Amycolatopsis iheyensis]
MPKVVDHDARRREIIGVVWRLVAEEGIQSVTTRRIAEAAGFANGALLYYFPNKDAVLIAAFQHIFDSTNTRADKAEGDRRGLAGLRTLCLEIMPLDDDRLTEARLAITFWQQALNSPEKAEMHAGFMNRWRVEMGARLTEAVEGGEIGELPSVGAVVDELISMLMGLQVLGVLSPKEATPERQLAQLDEFFARLRG